MERIGPKAGIVLRSFVVGVTHILSKHRKVLRASRTPAKDAAALIVEEMASRGVVVVDEGDSVLMYREGQ